MSSSDFQNSGSDSQSYPVTSGNYDRRSNSAYVKEDLEVLANQEHQLKAQGSNVQQQIRNDKYNITYEQNKITEENVNQALKHIPSQQSNTLTSHQYSAHYTGGGPQGNPITSDSQSTSTASRKPQEMSALDRLKNIQSNFKRTWNGIDCNVSGRAGTSNFVNKKRVFTLPEAFIEEEERQKSMFKVFAKLKDLEEDKSVAVTSNTQNSTTSFNKTVTSSANSGGGFFSSNGQPASSQFYPSSQQNNRVKENEFIQFKNIKENQMVTHSQPFTGYQKSYHIENSELLYKMLRFDNKLVRSVLEANGFSHTESHEWNLLWSSSSCKSYLYEGLNEYQKINHFPSSYEITRKDRLCYNMVRMQERYGKQNFDFVPDTYILPDEFGDFYAHYQKLKQHDSKKNIWIVKPANSSQGKGIYIVDDINDVSVDDTSVISRYVTNPLLINGHKFDLRIYVLVTSYEPMRVYVFQEGLARFASETYTSKINKNNKYMHLTNYSINKKNDNFVQNENSEQDDFGFKWSLSAFCKHLEQVGIDMNLLWSRINDVILKTLICGEHHVMSAIKKNGMHRTNCFELFGFDVLIDSDLKPWLLEVNLSPSLATDSPLDMTIKSTLLSDVFNLIGVRRFDRKKESLNKIKHRMKGYYKQGASAKKGGLGGGIQGTSMQTNANQSEIYHQTASAQLYQLIDKFVSENPQDYGNLHESLRKAASLRQKEYIREVLQEYQKKGNFVRIYPAKGSEIYDSFFGGPKPYNKLVYKVLYTDEVMRCIQAKPSTDMKLGYKIEIPPGSYEQYKNKQHERVNQQQTQKEESKSHKPAGDSMNDTVQSAQSQQQQPKTTTQRQQLGTIKDRPATTSAAVSNPSNTTKDTSSNQATTGVQHQASLNSSMNQTSKSIPTQQLHPPQVQQQQQQDQQQKQQEKVLITGDDILIEYVERLMNAIKQLSSEDQLLDSWKIALDRFITHYVWHSQDRKEGVPAQNTNSHLSPYWFRLEGRLNEMQERRRRLIKYLYKKEGKLNEFEEGFKQSISKKSTIIRKFTSIQLEDLLRTSTKNVAQEVVSSLIPSQGGLGVLADIDRIFLNSGASNSNETKRNNSNNKVQTQFKRREEYADEYDQQASDDINNRGVNVRQSKSANAARSLTRKNQQQLSQNEEIFPMHSQTKQQNLINTGGNPNSAANRMIGSVKGAIPTNRMVFTQGTSGIATVDQSQQNLTDMIQKREISSTYIKRILDNQAVLK